MLLLINSEKSPDSGRFSLLVRQSRHALPGAVVVVDKQSRRSSAVVQDHQTPSIPRPGRIEAAVARFRLTDGACARTLCLHRVAGRACGVRLLAVRPWNGL